MEKMLGGIFMALGYKNPSTEAPVKAPAPNKQAPTPIRAKKDLLEINGSLSFGSTFKELRYLGIFSLFIMPPLQGSILLFELPRPSCSLCSHYNLGCEILTFQVDSQLKELT